MRNLIVDCEVNSLQNYAKGQPHVLGFEFYCDDDKVEETIRFIKDKLNEYHRPLIVIDNKHMYYAGDTKPSSFSYIAETIKRGYLLD